MTPQEFDVALASALRICRAVAKEALPIEEMLAFVSGQIKLAPLNTEAERKSADALYAAQSLIEAVGDVAEIGSALPLVFSNLPPEPTPIRVPEPQDALLIPGNLLTERRGR